MSENALEDKLKQIMDEKVRPLLAAHQGNIQVVDVKAGIVTVRLTGACATCPGSRSTVADIVETQIKEALHVMTNRFFVWYGGKAAQATSKIF